MAGWKVLAGERARIDGKPSTRVEALNSRNADRGADGWRGKIRLSLRGASHAHLFCMIILKTLSLRRSATVLLDNRALEGHPGFIVVTPLELADGTSLAVERGWLPRDLRERTRIAPFATPEGIASVEGRVAATPSRLFEFAQASAPRGAIRQNLDLDAWAREHGLRLLPWVLRQEDTAAATVSADGLLRRWPAPAVDVAKNYGYAVQWFALSALVAGLYVWFHVVRPLRGR